MLVCGVSNFSTKRTWWWWWWWLSPRAPTSA